MMTPANVRFRAPRLGFVNKHYSASPRWNNKSVCLLFPSLYTLQSMYMVTQGKKHTVHTAPYHNNISHSVFTWCLNTVPRRGGQVAPPNKVNLAADSPTYGNPLIRNAILE